MFLSIGLVIDETNCNNYFTYCWWCRHDFSFTYGKEHLRYNSMMSAIDESMRIASIKSLDNSARVKSGEARISEDIFEKTFKKQMKTSSNYKIDNKNICLSI
ncbi:hypothetical protein OE903_23350 [Bacillus sp. B6(2022)]|nr:hypothetical protein [Bacillus sp. B6(2022)]